MQRKDAEAQRKLLDALSHKNQSGTPPLWVMRQAGRYLPEYRALRNKHSFWEMCHTPELAAEVTLQPLRRFSFDASIVFSDILIVAEALGFEVEFVEQKGPVIAHPFDEKSPLFTDPAVFETVYQTIDILKKELTVPLLGFCGAPFTVASYIVEGGSSRDFAIAKKWMLHKPEYFHRLLKAITQLSISYLQGQVSAGVNAVQIFESWAPALGEAHLKTFCLPYVKQMIDALSVPVIFFARGGSSFVPDYVAMKPTALSLDWTCSLAEVRENHSLCLQGNLDPHYLFAPPKVLEKEVRRILTSMENDPAFIFNLGHGILPNTPLESVHKLIEVVQCQSALTSSHT